MHFCYKKTTPPDKTARYRRTGPTNIARHVARQLARATDGGPVHASIRTTLSSPLQRFALAESMGLAVIAEGVETQAQRDALDTLGCHAFQGYLFSRPLPIDDFETFTMRT